MSSVASARPPAHEEKLGLVAKRAAWRAYLSRCNLASNVGEIDCEHRAARLVLVLGGGFRYRCQGHLAIASQGAVLAATAGQRYAKQPLGSTGDTCLVFEFDGDGASPQGPAGWVERYRAPSPLTAAQAALAKAAIGSGDSTRLGEVADILLRHTAGRAVDVLERPLTFAQEERIMAVVGYMTAHFDDDCSLSRLSDISGFSSFHTLRLFRRLMGQTPRQWLLAKRLLAAGEALRSSHRQVIEVALESGFSDLSNFNAAFRRHYGLTPRDFRARSAPPARPPPVAAAG